MTCSSWLRLIGFPDLESFTLRLGWLGVGGVPTQVDLAVTSGGSMHSDRGSVASVLTNVVFGSFLSSHSFTCIR